MKRNSVPATIRNAILFITFLTVTGTAQTVTYGQQISILKSLKADLHVIGVMAGNISESDIVSVSRTAKQQGLEVFVARPKDGREIPELYKKLIRDKKVQIILIPNADDNLMSQIGYEYLKENAILDKIGICVPDIDLFNQGAFCFITKEDGKFMVYVNGKISSFVGAAVPKEENSSITYVVR
jgi:ABC-type uncharacterized transport system substrate-binding protein